MKISEENLKEARYLTNIARAGKSALYRIVKDVAYPLGAFEIATTLQSKSDEIAALKARIAELEKSVQWQPIDTAPKDGSPILAIAKGYLFPFVSWFGCDAYEKGDLTCGGCPHSVERHWCVSGCEDGDSTLYAPDYWMPLPKPPKKTNNYEGAAWRNHDSTHPASTDPGTPSLNEQAEPRDDEERGILSDGKIAREIIDKLDEHMGRIDLGCKTCHKIVVDGIRKARGM